MCSVNEDDLDGVSQCMVKESSELKLGSICKKCNEKKADVVLRAKDAYCKDCFLTASTHKFRAALGKSKLVRPRDKVLIAFSGSQSSVALLHLVQTGLNGDNHKRLLFSCSVVYIDEGAVFGLSSTERKAICDEIVQHVKQTDIPVYITSLEKSLFDLEETNYFRYDTDQDYVNEQKEQKLKDCFSSRHSLTTRENLLELLRNRLLLKVAKHLKCTKIFTADTMSHLAVKLLTNVSLGRGSQLPLDVGFCDNRDADIMLLRPMRDFLKKEIVYYNVFNDLQSINIPSLGTKVKPNESIQKLTEKFVTDLQEDFPSTVSTIFRTGEKMSMNNVAHEADETCALCQAPLDTDTIESSALQSTEFSRKVSALGPSGFDSTSIGTMNTPDEKPQCEESASCHCKENELAISRSDAESCLCYSCRLILREM
ncbi:hypothetical protein L9F63_015126, partial [Diploptera punctata]